MLEFFKLLWAPFQFSFQVINFGLNLLYLIPAPMMILIAIALAFLVLRAIVGLL